MDKEKDDPCRIQESSFGTTEQGTTEQGTTETNIDIFRTRWDLFRFYGMGGGSS